MATIVAKMLGLQPHSEEYKSIYFGTLLHDIGYLSPKLKLELENADIIERAKIEQSHVITCNNRLRNCKQNKLVEKHLTYYKTSS